MNGEDAVSDWTCEKWFVKFCAGNFSLDDAPWSGRPTEVDSDQIETLIENNQCYTTGETEDILKMSKSIKLLVKMKNVSFILRKKHNGLFGQPNSFSWDRVLLRRTECSGIFLNGSFSPSVVSWCLLWVPVRAPGGKTQKNWGSSMTGSPWRLVPAEWPAVPQLTSYRSGFPTPALVPMELLFQQVWFFLLICFSNLGTIVCPVTSPLTDIGRVVEFSFSSALTGKSDEVEISKLITCPVGNYLY